MFERLGASVYRWRLLVFISALIGVVLCAILGFGVIPKLDSGGFNDPGSDSAAAEKILQEDFDSPGADLIVALKGTASADDLAFAALGKSISGEISALAGVKRVTS